MTTVKELKEWAKKYGLEIHPGREQVLDSVVARINEKYKGGCMCCKDRPKCPCPESIKECNEGLRGCCTCTLLINPERYEEHMKDWGKAHGVGNKKRG